MCESAGSWYDYMHETCARACAFCDPTSAPHADDCEDVDTRCPDYEAAGRCEHWPDWVFEYCRESCGFCN